MRLVTLATVLAICLVQAPAVMAKGGNQQPPCPPGYSQCPPAQHKAKPGKSHQAAPQAPKVGTSARNGRPFHQARNSRLKHPPQGQEYRVINDHIVRVDSKTMQIIAVVGLLNALTQ